MSRKIARRDKCFIAGKRASRLPMREAGWAWRRFSNLVESMEDRDLPKFNDLFRAFRLATIYAKKRKRWMTNERENQSHI